MDADALLARQLQELEFQQQGQASSMESKDQFTRMCNDTLQKVQEAEDEMLQALAMSLMPWDSMQAAAQRTWALNQTDAGTNSPGHLREADYLMMELLVWFKSFFSWVDAPACSTCSQPTTPLGTGPPTPEEAAHKASRTESFLCRACGCTTRFPRYNSVAKLLDTRRGRCGEWANAFLLFCRAAGFTARYIWDINDHVWTEFWSDGLGRWVHLDPCEAAFDKPLLYEAGWGKAMSYVLGLGTSGAVDVTPRYTAKWLEVTTRRVNVPEAWLSQQLTHVTHTLRAGLPPHLAQRCLQWDQSETQELSSRRVGVVSSADLSGLGARTTGSEAWRQERGEAGADGTTPAATSSPAPPPSSTPWVALPPLLWAPDNQQQGAGDVFELVGRVMGGGSRASGENGRAEGSASAFDGDVSTKWLDFGGGGVGGGAWLEYKLDPGQAPLTLAAYDLVSANDCEERDPRDWVVEGLVDPPQQQQQQGPPATPATSTPATQQQQQQPQWVVLDTQKGVIFDRRHQIRSFWISEGVTGSVTGGGRCRAWRLRVTSVRDPTAANSIQLGGWSLYAAGEAWGAGQAPISSVPGSVDAAAEVARRAAPALPTLQRGLMHKLMANIANNPADNKFRTVRASKITSLLSHPHSLSLLLAVGFRPLITRPPPRHHHQRQALAACCEEVVWPLVGVVGVRGLQRMCVWCWKGAAGRGQGRCSGRAAGPPTARCGLTLDFRLTL